MENLVVGKQILADAIAATDGAEDLAGWNEIFRSVSDDQNRLENIGKMAAWMGLEK